ncbi:MAG: TldD/PmbA family protein [Candidatus Cloacimonetes bacterium]|nr:TldD/PmbA family protein [Candidatus Cloacimonadota bacterium]MCF7813557.1 TldD/PmbA family protein [Candidatus Cloacimonadota bacterium]MCF7868188.1 TldD/PmbA family protein [Candidatus Cloacimonadota bacterium]MCF7883648.1 TldD/PmbA family protein [Candidatus Cloacimonadota bacterium]
MLDRKLIEKVIDKALSNGADFAEIYVEDTYNSRISFNDSKTKQSIAGKDFGAGVRVFYGTTAIYAYTNDLSERSLLAAADAVSKAAKGGKIITSIDLTKNTFTNLHPIKIPNDSVPKSEKVDYLRRIDKAARSVSDMITQVDMNLLGKMQKIMIANSEGLWAEDSRTYTRVSANAIASKGSEKQSCSDGPGEHKGFELLHEIDPIELGEKIAKTAILMLNADYAPSGKFPVVVDNGFGGVIFHEACGHALETTSVAKGASVFADKMGKRVANPVLTAIDDGTTPNGWGSTNIDDEGMPTQKTVLIENGILKSFIVDKMGSIKTGYARTGSGRRQSYKFAPASRMRNTYIAAGTSKLEDLISSVDYGIYAKKMGGGSVMPGTGNFNFAVNEGYIIRKGKIAEPVRGASLIGNGPESIKQISMVADNLKMAPGMCGSVSGSIPANVGQPAVKIDEIIVGGRK